MRKFGTPGVTVSVVHDGRLILAKGYGYADTETGRRVDGHETLFRIGSVSKTFVWASIMMLHERGLIDLDTDVNTYLKDYQLPDAFDEPVTLNHLMSHRAGFEETFGVFMHRDDGGTSLLDILKGDEPRRVNAPGARASYSNWGSGLAAKIVEDVTGLPFETFLQDEILMPLAMTRTTIKGPSIAPDHLKALYSHGYKMKNGIASKGEPMQIGAMAPIGAIGASAADMAQWMQVLLGGGAHNSVRLWQEQTAAKMFSRAFSDHAQATGLAHGFFTRELHGVEAFGHGGGTEGFRTYMEVTPALNAGVFISQNTAENAGLIREISDLVIARLVGVPVHSGAVSGLSEDAAKAYVGSYSSNRRSWSKFEKLFAVGSITAISYDDSGVLVVRSATGTRAFAPLVEGSDVFEDINGQRLQFGRDDRGRVTHYSVEPHSYERVSGLGDPNFLNVAIGAVSFFAMTMVLGAWRRQGRDVSQSSTGRLIGLLQIASVASVIFFFIGLVLTTMEFMDFGASDFLAYPPTALIVLRAAALSIVIAAVFCVASLYPTWRNSGWSIWRKSHHTFFAIALAFAASVFIEWNIVFAPFSSP